MLATIYARLITGLDQHLSQKKSNWKSTVSDCLQSKHSCQYKSLDAPTVEKLDTELYTGVDLEEEIVCTVQSSPRAQVTWTKDGQTLENNPPDLVFGQEANKHSLTLKKINADTFGKYTCEAKNDFRRDSSFIEVSGLASFKW